MRAWIRVLEVTLKSSTFNKVIRFGNISNPYEDELNISVVCNKYMSSLKDTCTIKIDNLTYNEVLQIIDGKYYDVEVKCGYRNSNIMTIFKGGVLYISNAFGDRKTNTIIILCASNLIAKFGQQRINLTFKSPVNMYNAINYINRRLGIKNAILSEKLNDLQLTTSINANETLASFLNNFTNQYTDFAVNSDSSREAVYSLFNIADRQASTPIVLDDNLIDLSGGYPRLTNDGLSLTILPTFAFNCGDTIKINNAMIDISAYSREEANRIYGLWRVTSGTVAYGTYIIYEMAYQLENRSSSFSLNMKCKNYGAISTFLGASSNG